MLSNYILSYALKMMQDGNAAVAFVLQVCKYKHCFCIIFNPTVSINISLTGIIICNFEIILLNNKVWR